MSDDDVDEIEHSERGPSTAHRWRKCKASVRASRGIPNVAGIEAAYGTVFHEYAALCVELGIDPQGFVGDKMYVNGFGWLTFDQEMADSMLNGLDLVWALADVPGAKMIVETKVNLEIWVGPGEFGTTDIAIVDTLNWRIVVFDWKYGRGVPVSPEMNDQAILYTLGTWSSFAAEMFEDYLVEDAAKKGQSFDPNTPWEDDIEVIIMIEQPRAPGGGGSWTTTMGFLLAEGRRIRKDADESLLPDAPFVPGPKQCQFCPAARVNSCKARTGMLLAEVGQDFDGLDLDFAVGAEMEMPDTRSLTPEQRSQILLHRSMIEKFLEQLHTEAYQDATSRRPTPGLKLVEGRNPPRKWKDEVKAEILLEYDFQEKAFSRKLLSPAQVEDKVGKRVYSTRFSRMVDKGESKPQLVPDTDKRQPLPDITSDFDGLNDDETLV